MDSERERNQRTVPQEADQMALPELEFAIFNDNLGNLIRHRRTSKAAKAVLKKIYVISLEHYKYISNRFLQIASYSKQMIEHLFSLILVKDKKIKKQKLLIFKDFNSKLK